ncbi:glutathione S-transferase [Pseudomonas syringae]|uniref:Glutathione S-transferase n=1 Tax=Pseudomonas syringae TaxID=317 RepID=A0A9Q4A6D1_PSESX|nr:glutathione S-transferase [Pseudomonas syringae]KTB84739.1 glutathione S-transferase [Pseudomonas syringae pv. syringae PD2766]MCF5467823.1 glutathione S-transferase [Pseudomonas syringae]MCF5472348.1 glutathione S-transferase [Pseudomonas syringae]MCF5481674.1 glutathione S-transferase [Pseudomonas syringae]MCF5488083.1 glutathione S-transferase [Pseudomonas syringae]
MTTSNQHLDTADVPMMKIHDWFNGPYPARVRIALAEKDLLPRIEFVSINLWTGEHKKPEFLAINYSGTLPVLELEDGTLIAECTAITQYLDALNGDPVLTGRTALEKGLIHMMTKRAEIEFLDAVSAYFHHATPGLGPQVEICQNAEWGNRMRDKAVRGMHYFDSVLKNSAFVAGEHFSMADIAVFGGMIFASLVELPVPDECEALRAWHQSMQERPSVQKWQATVALGAPQS